MYVVISGQVGEYIGVKHNKLDEVEQPDELFEPIQAFGKENLTDKENVWGSTFVAVKRSLLLNIAKKDLIEVLQHVKVLNQSNKQTFLINSQFLKDMSYNRVLELNDQLQE